jgi:hypothetical protein
MPITSQAKRAIQATVAPTANVMIKMTPNLEDLEGLASTDGEADLAASIIFLFP